MLDLRDLDLQEIATALEDQAGYEHRWLINPRSGEVGGTFGPRSGGGS
jgi:hypothetical protein